MIIQLNESPARTWRDLMDDLTDVQIKHFTHAEDHGHQQCDLLEKATCSAVRNAGHRIFFGNLPIPPGATAISIADTDYGGMWTRDFSGDRQIIGEEDVDSIQVQIGGRQFSSGRVEQWVDFLVEESEEPEGYSRRELRPSEARAVAHMLLNAANQIAPQSEAESIRSVGAFAYFPDCADPAQTATVTVGTPLSAMRRISGFGLSLDGLDGVAPRMDSTGVKTGPDAPSALRARLTPPRDRPDHCGECGDAAECSVDEPSGRGGFA